jgi:two-component system, cell cycle response regulator
MAAGRRVRQLGLWLTSPPDEALADAAREGELIVARIRTWATLLLLTTPVLSMLVDGRLGQNLLGLAVAVSAAVVAIVIELILQRGFYRPGIAFMTSITDVTIISVGLFVYWAVGIPIVTTNSRVMFECYFLAIGASALRYDHRVTIAAGAVAIVQYALLALASWLRFGGTELLSANAEYGRFDWATVMSRCIVLLAMTVVSLAVVSRAQRLRSLSTNDRLTGMFSRAYIEEYLGNEVLRTARAKGALVVAMLDVDRFKQFNDTYGHAAGDAALKQVARALQEALRRTDIVARYGGEEVLIVLPATTLQAAMDKLDEVRVRIGLTDIKLPRGGTARVTVSIGVAAWDQDGRVVDALLDLADKRLYAAKDAGRNRVFGPAEMPQVSLSL